MQISWLSPNNRGSVITAYVIKIRHSDDVNFSQDVVNCNGSDSTIRNSLSCQVPFTSLRTTPFSLQWGSSLYAKVTAVNAYGNSVESTEGNGAIILTNPDAPLNFVNVPGITLGTRIGLSWVEGNSNGGTAVIDYSI